MTTEIPMSNTSNDDLNNSYGIFKKIFLFIIILVIIYTIYVIYRKYFAQLSIFQKIKLENPLTNLNTMEMFQSSNGKYKYFYNPILCNNPQSCKYRVYLEYEDQHLYQDIELNPITTQDEMQKIFDPLFKKRIDALLQISSDKLKNMQTENANTLMEEYFIKDGEYIGLIEDLDNMIHLSLNNSQDKLNVLMNEVSKLGIITRINKLKNLKFTDEE